MFDLEDLQKAPVKPYFRGGVCFNTHFWLMRSSGLYYNLWRLLTQVRFLNAYYYVTMEGFNRTGSVPYAYATRVLKCWQPIIWLSISGASEMYPQYTWRVISMHRISYSEFLYCEMYNAHRNQAMKLEALMPNGLADANA